MSREARLDWPRALHNSWRNSLACFIVGVTLQCASSRAPCAEFMAGADVSGLAVLEDHGAVYTENGEPGDVIEMFSDHGVNWYRLRLFVDPNGQNLVVNDLDYTIQLAKRTKAAGGKLLLDFHYSDTWADPGRQNKPSAWANLDYPQLEQQVYDYTKEVVEAFKAEDVLPEMVQIGNEISSGLLWNPGSDPAGPNSGYPWTGGTHSAGFDRLAGLLTAGINGAREAAPGQEPLIMIHHDRGSVWNSTEGFFDRLLPRLQANDADVDVIGYSYYPLWHPGGIEGLEENLNETVDKYDKPVVVVEAGYSSRCPQCESQRPPDPYQFPISEEGQQAYLQAVVDTVQAVPNKMGWGVFWWYPEANTEGVSGLNVWKGGRYGLFDADGELLPAIDVFANITPPLVGDYNGDSTVDVLDLGVWERAYGRMVNNVGPDGNHDGLVDGVDFLLWQRNYGQTASASHAAPEPAALSLLIIGVVVKLGLPLR